MTGKQIERVRVKIKKICATLAAEKRKFGCYDDSRGIRFLPPELFIKIRDYPGGLKYLRWFDKTFPDGGGLPDFLFEWTVILFKNGKIREAEKKAFETFCANTYLYDKFFGNSIVPIDKYEYSNLSVPEFAEDFHYSCAQEELVDFAVWLRDFLQTERFQKASETYIAIEKKLKYEKDREKRRELVNAYRQLAEEF